MRVIVPIVAGSVLGLSLSAALAYLWLCFGSAPHTDGIISF